MLCPASRAAATKASARAGAPLSLGADSTAILNIIAVAVAVAVGGGGGEIRTLGARRLGGFQDRCIRPLCYPSKAVVSVIRSRQPHLYCRRLGYLSANPLAQTTDSSCAGSQIGVYISSDYTLRGSLAARTGAIDVACGRGVAGGTSGLWGGADAAIGCCRPSSATGTSAGGADGGASADFWGCGSGTGGIVVDGDCWIVSDVS